jgi:hypothetical protein
LAVIDQDLLGPENLDAMPHVSCLDLGRPKAVLLAESLQRNQPDLALTCLSEAVLRYLNQSRPDIVCSFVDNNAARLTTGWKCQQGEIVHLDIGTLIERTEDGKRGLRADIRLFEPRRGCVACVPQLPALEDTLYEASAPAGAMQRGRPILWNEQRAGSLLHWNAFACSLAMELLLSYLEGTIRTSHWVRVHAESGRNPRIESASVGPAEDCPFCSGHSAPVHHS